MRASWSGAGGDYDPAMLRRTLIAVLLGLLVLPALGQDPRRRGRPLVETDNLKLFQRESPLLTAFWGRPIAMTAGVVLPPDFAKKEHLPVCYSIHGFGGSYRSAWRTGPRLLTAMEQGDYPRMIYVFLDASCPLGHHEFADSVNNGPVGQALITEFIPALEAEYGAYGEPRGRFLTGHSSGGWSSLWLQVNYPEFFNGTWSTAPDSVDFHDFTGVDVYDWDNVYKDPDGAPIQLVRRHGEWAMTIEEFVQHEVQRQAYGGQFASFDAVFSPRGEDGRPMPMFDRETGAIDHEVGNAWAKYDITKVVQRNWDHLADALRGKVHVYVGTQDTFRLEGALHLFDAATKELGADFEILFVEGRDHGTLFQPHPEYWPEGMLEHIHRAMAARFAATGD
jgi:S-formylglutathione hydrolase FrmB